jgi:hypothetical protein
MQSRLGSLAESLANIVVGFSVNYAANLLILPHYGFTSLTAATNFQIGVLYTGVSLARSFVLRRYFNGLRFGNRA